MKSSPDLGARLAELARSENFRRYQTELLLELCRIETTPNPDVSVMQRAEAAAFAVVERELNGLDFAGARYERRPINPAIADHPNYSLLHFTKTPTRPQGLSPKTAYAGRSNLLFFVPGTAPAATTGANLALNAHVDVIAPYFPPRLENGIVYGRGSNDDKASVVAIVGALKILNDLLPATERQPRRNIVAMFVIEEETGGNGSLSLALDRDLKTWYDTILVGECADNRIHPANRGAVWYKAELRCPAAEQLEVAAAIIAEFELAGRALKAESRHPLFPQRPVQTCHGIIGPFGEHPSRICGEVSFEICFEQAPAAAAEAVVRDSLESGLAEYLGLYGDKTKVTDPATGKPKVDHHYDLMPTENGWQVAVHGSSGHMGSILDNDGAITKMASLVRALARSRAKIETAGGGCPLRLLLSRHTDPDRLILEGGQGFIPTHAITEVMARLQQAAERGAGNWRLLPGNSGKSKPRVRVTYEKLHNAAFDGDPDSPAMRRAMAAAKACGMWRDEPVCGWTVSCDSRLFATEYPGMAVLTAGPGKLAYAHSDREQIAVDDLCRFSEFLALYILNTVYAESEG